MFGTDQSEVCSICNSSYPLLRKKIHEVCCFVNKHWYITFKLEFNSKIQHLTGTIRDKWFDDWCLPGSDLFPAKCPYSAIWRFLFIDLVVSVGWLKAAQTARIPASRRHGSPLNVWNMLSWNWNLIHSVVTHWVIVINIFCLYASSRWASVVYRLGLWKTLIVSIVADVDQMPRLWT